VLRARLAAILRTAASAWVLPDAACLTTAYRCGHAVLPSFTLPMCPTRLAYFTSTCDFSSIYCLQQRCCPHHCTDTTLFHAGADGIAYTYTAGALHPTYFLLSLRCMRRASSHGLLYASAASASPAVLLFTLLNAISATEQCHSRHLLLWRRRRCAYRRLLAHRFALMRVLPFTGVAPAYLFTLVPLLTGGVWITSSAPPLRERAAVRAGAAFALEEKRHWRNLPARGARWPRRHSCFGAPFADFGTLPAYPHAAFHEAGATSAMAKRTSLFLWRRAALLLTRLRSAASENRRASAGASQHTAAANFTCALG